MQTDACALSFRLGEKTPSVVRRCLESLSYREALEEDDEHWSIHWRVGNFKTGDWERCLPHQRINHLPKAWHITTKDHLVRSLRNHYRYSFTPQSWILPSEYTKFMRDYYQEREKDESCLFIAKPADLSRGRGIYLVRELSEVVYDQPYIMQQYVQRPLTVDGFKFDLRIYVLVLSAHPLVAFVYNQGIARFATHKYSTDTIDDLFVHLTNASINKNVPDAEDGAAAAPTIAGGDCKQLMSSVWTLLKERGINTARLWERICRILTATVAILVTKVPNVPEVASGFELFGFDVLLDSDCRPWLMEVNCSPALSMDGAVDSQVKVPLLKDTFQMVTLHTRALKIPAVSEASSVRSSSASLSKGPPSSVGATARVMAADSQKSSRSLSAPRLGIKSAGSEPVSSILQAQHKQASRPSLTRPGAAQPAALNKAKPDVLSATSVASAKVPKSYQPKVGGRPPLPPPSAQGSDGSQTRARRPSLDEGITPVVGPLAAPPARAPTALQIRADALPTAVMAFVAEAGALVEGRYSCLWPLSFREAQLSVDASRTGDIKAMIAELKMNAREGKTARAASDYGV